MPPAPKRPCSYPGCGALSTGSRCERHPRGPWLTSTGKPTKRIRGRALQKLRADLFRRNPLCAECEKAGRITLATIRDHITPLAEQGADDRSNEQGLCEACHDIKSREEDKRGIARARLQTSPGG